KYGEGEGGFLQVSGLRYVFNPALAPGSRVTRAEFQSPDGQWLPVDKKSSYRVVTADFIANGGDGFDMFKALFWEEGDTLANDSLRIYLEEHSPIAIQFEGRIGIEE
ncbi:MAG: multifunctional 2',3'-cyclic-nucleotide 2'-phosphodiesterase/5'-nucleotidase/3'-nucleotidase, partial [Desulfovibrionales bacterium]|nr:multifunctional 2',3'-cyclic-nucleotide 2'-phosphodiesterase/5'-nucleotidase/3'-nucleotidase [Desulfovibrionales bacterium]